MTPGPRQEPPHAELLPTGHVQQGEQLCGPSLFHRLQETDGGRHVAGFGGCHGEGREVTVVMPTGHKLPEWSCLVWCGLGEGRGGGYGYGNEGGGGGWTEPEDIFSLGF